MKLASYLEKIDQTDPCDIEAFINLSFMAVNDRFDLCLESRDLLTYLLAEKVIEAGKKLRAKKL